MHDIVVLGIGGKEVNKVLYLIYFAFERRKLPPKPLKCVRPSKDCVKVLMVEYIFIGLIEPSAVIMNKLLNFMHAFLKKRF